MHELHENAKVKVLVCAVERGEQVYIPSGNFKIEEGDKIHVTAETRDLTKLIHYLGIPLPKMRDVVIVGGSRLGYYLANMLIQSGVKVKIIEIDYERCLQLSELLPKALIINGDGCQQKLLNEEVYGKGRRCDFAFKCGIFGRFSVAGYEARTRYLDLGKVALYQMS